MSSIEQRTPQTVCQNLRWRVLHHVYGPKVIAFDNIQGSLLADLYPFDYDYLTAYVEKLLDNVGDFDEAEAQHHPIRYHRFVNLMRSMVTTGTIWYDIVDMSAEGLLAYRIAGYDRASFWVKNLNQRFPKSTSPVIVNRLGKAVTIIAFAEELDEAYFTGAYAEINKYARDPQEIFTELIDWFIEFLDTYAQIAKRQH